MASQLVLRTRDLFLSVAMQCVHPSQLATLSALCREFEDLVFTQRQLWRRQLALLWPLPSARETRDPRSLCRRLLEGWKQPVPLLTSLDAVVMLVSFRKHGTEHAFEFNLGSLTFREVNLAPPFKPPVPEPVAWLPMPSLVPTDAAHAVDLMAAYARKNVWFRRDRAAQFPWMADADSFEVVLLRTDVHKVSRGEMVHCSGGNELRRDGVLLVPALETNLELNFGATYSSEGRLGEHVPPRSHSEELRLDFHARDGGWVMRLLEETHSKRGDKDWFDEDNEEELHGESLPLHLLREALNKFRWS